MERSQRFNLIAFGCALLLSVGSHYGRELLGPLKTQLLARFDVSNVQFALLFAAHSLASTWTPLLAPYMASKIGLPLTSIIATGAIFLGQTIVALSSLKENVGGMLLGLGVFGLGISPVAICTEVVIIRYFKDSRMGVSLALGLLGGKGASFVSSISAYPLSRVSPHLPFFVSTIVAGLSFCANLCYLAFERRRRESRASDTAKDALLKQQSAGWTEEDALVDEKQVRLGDISLLGDTFWLYILFSALCGALINPIHHNLAHILQLKYFWTAKGAAYTASGLLAVPLIVYPLAGLYVDKRKDAASAINLLMATSLCTLLGFIWLALPLAISRTPIPAILFLGVGFSIATLSLVLVAPFLVESPWMSTALGAHKSAESCFSTLSQAAVGHSLDKKLVDGHGDITEIMLGFLAVNLVQLGVAWCIRKQLLRLHPHASIEEEEPLSNNEQSPLLRKHHTSLSSGKVLLVSRGTQMRGKMFTTIFGGVVIGTMATFLALALSQRL